MSLSSDLISQFVKVTKDTDKTKKESTVNGTVVIYNGKEYVKFDGSELLTPVSSTASLNNGDRVKVNIKKHMATVTGNISSPSGSDKEVKQLGSQITEFEIVMAYKVTTDDLEATNAYIESLKAKVAKLTNADIVNAQIENLEAKYANLTYISSDDIKALNADIENLKATLGSFTDISTEDLEAINADIDHLQAYNANFTYVSADVLSALNADIKKLDTEKLSADEADIKYATIENLNAANATIGNLNADYGEFKLSVAEDFTAVNADIGTLNAEKLSVKDAELKYANIDFSNIGKAAIESFYAKSGLIKDIVVGDGTITGELVGVTIKGDLIEGNTIIADKLVVKGEDGLYYKLNTDGVKTESEQTDYNSLSGSIITAKSITATKIAVDDLVAFDATIGGFNITEDAIYSGVKESADNTTRGIYLDNEGQFSVGDSSNYLKYYKDQNGDYKLEVSAGSIKLSASNKYVESEISDIWDSVNDVNSSVNSRIDDALNRADEVAESSQQYVDNKLSDYANLDDLEKVKLSVSQDIQTTEDSILNTVSSKYMLISETDKIYETVTSMIEHSESNITMTFRDEILGVENVVELNKQNMEKYIRFDENGIELGDVNSPFKTNISNTEIYFSQNGNKIAYITNSKLYIKSAEFIDNITIGKDGVYYDWVIRSNKHLSLKVRTE